MCDVVTTTPEKIELPPILAVDFDGTLVADCFPQIGKPQWFIVEVVRQHQKQGWKLVLWTCRNGDRLQEAVDFCDQVLGLRFDAVNQNIPEVQALYGGDTRKVFADLYLDDKNAYIVQDPMRGSQYVPPRLVNGLIVDLSQRGIDHGA